MAFSCSYILSKVRSEADNSDEHTETPTTLKRPCPFTEEKLDSDILPEAVDVLDSIFDSLCSVSKRTDEEVVSLGEKKSIKLYKTIELKHDGINCSTRQIVEIDSTDVLHHLYSASRIVQTTEIDLTSDESDKKLQGQSDGKHINEIDLTIDESSSDTPKAETSNTNLDSVEEQEAQAVFDFSRTPLQITGSWKEFVTKKGNNYTRGCKWAPDGSCILTCSEDDVLRVFNIPGEIWDTSRWDDIPEMESVLRIQEGEQVYDYCWYPQMNSLDPSTCCLMSSSRNGPVHLWDAFTGELRCSYRCYDQMDEVTAARSVAFDSCGDKIFCGFDKTIRVFDVNLPGRNFEERHTFAKKSGQSGIISCFAFTPANKRVSAAGSYRKTIGIYSEPDGQLECLLEGQQGGVTQVVFSYDGTLLFSGGRKDPEILCWDMRNLGEVLFSLRRCCKTNQRMYFDVSSCGRYAVSGNHNGVISVWDLYGEPKECLDSYNVLEPVQFYMAHGDCVNGISLHPSYPLLCSSSGQRRYPALLEDEEEQMFASEVEHADNSLRLWWVGK